MAMIMSSFFIVYSSLVVTSILDCERNVKESVEWILFVVVHNQFIYLLV